MNETLPAPCYPPHPHRAWAYPSQALPSWDLPAPGGLRRATGAGFTPW